MTILFISHYSGFYGAAKSLLTLMLDLRERYHVTPVVLLPNKGVFCEELDKVNIKYYIFHYYWWVNDNHGMFQWLLNKRKQLINLFHVNAICRLFVDDKIDLVYSNSVAINIGVFVAEKMQLPHIWHFRESLSLFKLTLPKILSLFVLGKSVNKRYILISDYMQNYYKSYLPADRMVKIYNGISLPKEIRFENRIQGGCLNICIVGVFCEQKNQMDALHAILELKNRSYSNFCLHLIGSYKKEYLEQLQVFIQKNDLEKYVKIYGHSSNVIELLQTMNIGLMCSRDEAFGRVTIEYMQMRMPVIASVSGANAELIKNTENGFLYTLYDYKDLADKIEIFLQDEFLLESMGRNAYRHSLLFSEKKNTDEVYQQIKDVIKM